MEGVPRCRRLVQGRTSVLASLGALVILGVVCGLLTAIPGFPNPGTNAVVGFALVLATVAAWSGLLSAAYYRVRWLAVLIAAGVAVTGVGLAVRWPCLANVGRVMAGGAAGVVLGRQFRRAWWLGVAGLGAMVADLWSVFAGPTHIVLEKAPSVLGVLLVQVPALGGQGGMGLGVTDVLFLSLFVEGARVCRLRRVASLAGMTSGLLATVVVAVVARVALPALPLLSVGFLGVNADLLWRDFRRRGAA